MISDRCRRWVAAATLAGCATTVILLVAGGDLPRRVEGWRDARGLIPLCAGLFIVANVAFVPATVLALAVGFLIGAGPGFLVTWVCRTAAATAGFVISRTLAREAVERRAASMPRLAAIDDAVSERGFVVVTLIRLSPILPSTVSSYLFGATRIGLRPFVLGTVVGTVPSSLLYAWLGAGLSKAAAVFDVAPEHGGTSALFWIGLGATAVAFAVIGMTARRSLMRMVERH